MKDFKVYQASGCLTNFVVNASDVRDYYAESRGAIANFYSPISAQIISLTADINPIQEGQGIPSPTNIRPITGWTGCNIFRSGEDTSYLTTYPVSWQTEAGTVYGGTLTVNEDGSCDLSAEWRKEIYTSSLSPIASGQASSGDTWCTLEKNLPASSKAYAETPTAGDDNGMLNIGVWQRGSAGGIPRAFVTASLTSLQVVLTSDTYNLRTAQGRTDYFANTLNGNNPEVCYKLKTPVTYHLNSLVEITTFTGENNIWTDCGDIAVEYRIR